MAHVKKHLVDYLFAAFVVAVGASMIWGIYFSPREQARVKFMNECEQTNPKAECVVLWGRSQ